MNNNSEKTMLSEKELKASNALKRLGIPKMENLILLCLFEKEGLTAREIERTADLRQPEVSQSVNALKKKGWIKASSIRKDGKGRPYDRFHLAKPIEGIRADIKGRVQKKMETEKQDMNALYDMLGIET
ncbi:unnamed protein product [marine sediment metagenome]|uniref:Transcription regulator TrmB N-terminal domain-containing protein n=1 Tax=marine sediment metagenome TaxID=412755 RepID=X1GNU9_9ZZZZ